MGFRGGREQIQSIDNDVDLTWSEAFEGRLEAGIPPLSQSIHLHARLLGHCQPDDASVVRIRNPFDHPALHEASDYLRGGRQLHFHAVRELVHLLPLVLGDDMEAAQLREGQVAEFRARIVTKYETLKKTEKSGLNSLL